MHSFPLHRLEFKAMIPSLFGILAAKEKKNRRNRIDEDRHTCTPPSLVALTLRNLLTKYRGRSSAIYQKHTI